jgi:hypothetical protein
MEIELLSPAESYRAWESVVVRPFFRPSITLCHTQPPCRISAFRNFNLYGRNWMLWTGCDQHLIHRKGFHTESSPGVIYFTMTWSCRVTISNFRIFRRDLTVRESILCTKVGLNTMNFWSWHGNTFVFFWKKNMVVSAMSGEVYMQHI